MSGRHARVTSPCRVGRARRVNPAARVHVCSPWHAAVVESYREARATWEHQCESVAIGYAAEEADYRREHPAPTFAAWLVMFAGAPAASRAA